MTRRSHAPPPCLADQIDSACFDPGAVDSRRETDVARRRQVARVPLIAAWHDAGAIVALPVVQTHGAVLIFRRWTPETRMVRGARNTQVPDNTATVVVPEITLAPLVGRDAVGYRPGYGGGSFDRKLATPRPRPFAIGLCLLAGIAQAGWLAR